MCTFSYKKYLRPFWKTENYFPKSIQKVMPFLEKRWEKKRLVTVAVIHCLISEDI